MFEGFSESTIDTGDARIFVRAGGEGPPVLLLHGHPRTSSTWYRVAPRLIERGFTVVCPDLRGYGRSAGPAPRADHANYSKRVVAGDMLKVMRSLGHERFAMGGHDRGSYVALRLALDHPQAVTSVCLMDCLPISEHLTRITQDFATQWWHWFFYAQPGLPEAAITQDPEAWYGADPVAMGRENYLEWRAAVHNPAVVRAMLEDYRAGLAIDADHEREDRAAGRMLSMPLLLLWSRRDDLEQLYGDPREIWSDWAKDLRGHGIDSGHHMAEEAPEELSRALAEFFSAIPASG